MDSKIHHENVTAPSKAEGAVRAATEAKALFSGVINKLVETAGAIPAAAKARRIVTHRMIKNDTETAEIVRTTIDEMVGRVAARAYKAGYDHGASSHGQVYAAGGESSAQIRDESTGPNNEVFAIVEQGVK